jgi:hypothetical protein
MASKIIKMDPPGVRGGRFEVPFLIGPEKVTTYAILLWK